MVVNGLWLFFLAATFPVIWVMVGAIKDILDPIYERRREEERVAEIVSLRRRYVGIAGDDPDAHERLGDALRVAGHTQAALEAFEEAARLARQRPPRPDEPGLPSGLGLETKLRLVRLELAQEKDPEGFGLTMASRDIVCPLCKNLSPAGTLDCPHCNTPLPVNTMADAWKHDRFRQRVLSDSGRLVLRLLAVGVAIGCALAIPDALLKFTVLFCAVIALAALLWRRIGG